ncbi:MAG: two-component system response regulator GlrR [Thermodesulfovibrionales bacterium]
MKAGRILVVDDDRNLLEIVRIRLESENYEVVTSQDAATAKEAVKEQVFDLSLLDLQLEDEDGITLMEELRLVNPEMPAIIFTGHGSIESAVDAMKRGAYSYITKPFDHRELLLQIERALAAKRLNAEVRRLRGLCENKYGFSNIVTKSKAMQEVIEKVLLVADTDSTVFIQGESGTGKELVATALHLASGRKDHSFVAINCAALPEPLLESELFGYEKGAFTGALRSKAGLITQAHGGTLFLDEIGDLPLSVQAKLLRVLQDRRFYPVGGKVPVDVDVRFVVATNKDLDEEVRAGRFREDLFYRIHVIPMRLPPLRDRKEDIPPLVEMFMKEFSERMNKKVKGIHPAAMQKLMLYNWPGNVRELKNTIEYAVAMTQQNVITDDLILRTRAEHAEALMPLREARGEFEKSYLSRLLQVTGGNVSKAAELAGKYRADFYNLLRKYDIKPGEFKKD